MNNSTLSQQRKYPYPRNRWIRALLKAGIGLGVKLLTRTRVIGRENLPEEGPLIVVANHFHFYDAVILILSTPWPLEFLADFKMPNVPLPLKVFPALYGTYDVAQGTANLEAMRASQAILAQDGVLGIFPEGRVQEPPLRRALPGAAFLALRTGAPILPVGIYSDNDWKVFDTIFEEKRRLKATCHFGEVFGPLNCADLRRPSREAISQAGDRIMTEIARLLPESMQGDFPVNQGNRKVRENRY